MNGQEIVIGSVGMSVILSILLRIVYNVLNINNRFKPLIAVALGIGLSGIAIWVQGGVSDRMMLATYLVQGFMTGATATGLYEMTKKSGE